MRCNQSVICPKTNQMSLSLDNKINLLMRVPLEQQRMSHQSTVGLRAIRREVLNLIHPAPKEKMMQLLPPFISQGLIQQFMFQVHWILQVMLYFSKQIFQNHLENQLCCLVRYKTLQKAWFSSQRSHNPCCRWTYWNVKECWQWWWEFHSSS